MTPKAGLIGDRLTIIGRRVVRTFTTSVSLWTVILVGFVLRVYHLGFRPLWDDEAFSVLIIASDIGQVAMATARDTFPPLYYYFLSLAMMTMGWSEFAVRFASLVGSVLAIPVTFQLGKRLLGRPAGLYAALVMAFSPFMIYFAQEARAYSWMVLTSLLSVYAYARVISSLSTEGRASIGRWAVFTLASAAMLYTHFLSLWILVVEGLYFLWFWWHRRRGFRSWALAHVGIALLFLPWMLLLLGVGTGDEGRSLAGTRQLGGIETDAPIASLLWIWQEGQSTRSAITLVDTLWQALVSFTVGDFVPSPWETILALGFALIALLGVVGPVLLRRTATTVDAAGAPRAFPNRTAFLLLYAALPVLLSYLVAFPTSRPHWAKYFMMALPAYVLLVGMGLALLRRLHRVLAVLGTCMVIGGSLLALSNYFENPDYARADVRPGVRYLGEFSSPRDALLVNPPTGSPPFWYYHGGGLPHYSPDQADQSTLERIAADYAGLWVVQNTPVGFDPDESIERWLTHNTYRTFTDWVGQLIFRYYSMPSDDGPVLEEDFEQPVLFGDSVALRGYRVGVQTTGSAQIVQLDLMWQARAKLDADYMVGARVVDGEGRVWGQTNSAPLGNFRPTTSWQTGEVVYDHLGLLLWPGTPPGMYSVEIWMYREPEGTILPVLTSETGDALDRLSLEEVPIDGPRYPPSQAVLGIEERLRVVVDGLSLLGYSTTTHQARPGDDVGLVLFWQATRSDLPRYTALLSLEDRKGQRWHEESVTIGGNHTTDLWTTGQVVRDPHAFSVPPDAPAGTFEVRLEVADASGRVGITTTLFAVSVERRPKQFDVPPVGHTQSADLGHQVEFLGYDLPTPRVRAGATLQLTLYWRALSPMDTSYTVFNHLVGPRMEIVGQQDGIPMQGTLPTTDWVTGEVIRDVHEVRVRDDVVPGTICQLLVGLYDQQTGRRLAVFDTESSTATGDSIRLGSIVEIE